jgi:hypothetical protein
LRKRRSVMASTTGTRSATRSNLVTVAASPAVGEMVKPAPTTCATSWIVAPRNIPAVRPSNPRALAMIG